MGPGSSEATLISIPVMPRAAYLRVYLPAERFDGVREHVAATRVPKVLHRGDYGVWYESTRDDAFRIDWEGRRYVCPRHPWLRMLEGLIAFRNSYSGSSAAMLVPDRIADSAAEELTRMHRGRPGVRSYILTSGWHVPLRWFAAFDAAERELVEADGGLTIRYRTPLPEAVARLARAVRILDEAGFDEVIVEPVRSLIGWLDGFPNSGVVELDYGSVASLLVDGDLVLDESAAEVAASLDALEDGDLEKAGEYYAAVASRWAHAQSLAYAS
jgi:hypothetical protein